MSLVLYEREKRIAYITLNRPEKRNAINAELTKELAKTWIEFRDDENVWVAVLSGSGGGFCSGADVGAIGSVIDSKARPDSLYALSTALNCAPTRFEIWKPIIAAIHGYAVGAGLWLALCCDIRIAAENTKFFLPEPKYEVPTLFAGFLSRYIPRGIALELLLRANKIDEKRAYEIGLINHVVAGDSLISTATQIAEEICENGPTAIRAMKELVLTIEAGSSANIMALTEHVLKPISERIRREKANSDKK